MFSLLQTSLSFPQQETESAATSKPTQQQKTLRRSPYEILSSINRYIYIYIYICAVGAALSLTHDFYSVEMGLHLASPHPSIAPINFWILLPGKNKQTNIPQLQKRNPRPTNHLVFHLYPNQPENKREKNCRF